MEERLYDLIFIVRPATPEDEIKKVLSASNTPARKRAARLKRPSIGARASSPTALPSIARAIYVYQQIRTAHHELIAELERRLRVQDVGHQVFDRPPRRRSKAPEKARPQARAARRPFVRAAPHRPQRPQPRHPAAPEQAAAS